MVHIMNMTIIKLSMIFYILIFSNSEQKIRAVNELIVYAVNRSFPPICAMRI